MCYGLMGAQKNCLIETVLLSTHNICFGCEIKQIVFSNTHSYLEACIYGHHRCYLVEKVVKNILKKVHDRKFCLFFVWFDSLHPIINLSVIKGRVFLGRTSPKLGLMFLLKDTTQWRRWGSNPQPLYLESEPLRSHDRKFDKKRMHFIDFIVYYSLRNYYLELFMWNCK